MSPKRATGVEIANLHFTSPLMRATPTLTLEFGLSSEEAASENPESTEYWY
jgi:hypothetical protein